MTYNYMDRAIERIENFLNWEADVRPNFLDLGDAVSGVMMDINDLVDFVKAIRPVPTAHDQEKEMEKWDEVFYDMFGKKESK